MDASRDRRDPSYSVSASSLLGGYVALWLVMVLFLGALVYSGQMRQAREEFDARASAIHREVDTKLKANEIVLDGVAGFLRASATLAPGALQVYADQALARFPQITQVGVQRRMNLSAPPRVAGDVARRGGVEPVGEGARRSSAGDGAYLATVALGAAPGSPVPGVDLAAVGHLGEAASLSLERERAAASRMFSPGGRSAYALVRPVYPRADPRYEQYLVSLLVRVDELLPLRDALPRDLDVRLQHGHYAGGASQAWVVGGEYTGSALEGLIFPRLRAVRVFGTDAQPFVLTVDRQLGWSAINPSVAMAFALAACAGLVIAVSYGRTCARREEERRRSEQKLYRLANFDSLTELPNRNLFRDRLQQALSRARRHQRRVALFFLDLDGFKAVNDTAGHAAGDKLLQLVAGRLLKTVREHDTVARLSGDEFVILLEDIKNREDVERVLAQLHESFVESFHIGGHEFMLTASIGVATCPEDGEEAEQLLQRADQKMYAIKYPEWAPTHELPG